MQMLLILPSPPSKLQGRQCCMLSSVQVLTLPHRLLARFAQMLFVAATLLLCGTLPPPAVQVRHQFHSTITSRAFGFCAHYQAFL